MSTNELSVEITQEKDDAVNQLLDNLFAELDFLRDLSAKGRQRLVKMGRSNVDFVNRGYRHAEGSPQFLLSNITLEEFKKDIDLGAWLRKLEKRLDMLSDRVKDTAMLAESEAFKTARVYYGTVKIAAKAGSEEAEPIARDLSIHYRKQGVSQDGTTTGPEPATVPQETQGTPQVPQTRREKAQG